MNLPERIDLSQEDMDALLARVKQCICESDYGIIKAMADTIACLSRAVKDKNDSLKRLLKIIFGESSEQTKKVLKAQKGNFDLSLREDSIDQKPKGHGRNGASDYTGAQKIKVSQETLKPGDPCPACEKGKVYLSPAPGVIVRVTGRPPLYATVYELEKLRCNLCGNVFTANAPEHIGDEKYDASASAMIALLKYGTGVPFNRIEQLQAGMGIPVPSSTQWEIVEKAADKIYPAYDELIRQAACGDILHNDDTVMKILALIKENAARESVRKGIFTSGVLSVASGMKIALFFTGRKHAGENLTAVLAKRKAHLLPPVQMCDALSRNLPETFKVLLANCLTHARRNFIDVLESFPEPCEYVIRTLADVYKNDKTAKDQNMSGHKRLAYHQFHSGPLMANLKAWLYDQLDEKNVEPNSGLGKAIVYMQKHWEALTLFLRVPNAPLDNNICEQALKKAILHRKNSLFYKTEHGAYIGDLFMSLIHTCHLNHANPYDYLTTLQHHSSQVRTAPDKWMPWNYQNTLSNPVS